MIKNIVKLEVKSGERSYQLLCDGDSPLGELHDALSKMKGLIVQKIQEVERDSNLERQEDQSNG